MQLANTWHEDIDRGIAAPLGFWMGGLSETRTRSYNLWGSYRSVVQVKTNKHLPMPVQHAPMIDKALAKCLV